MVYVWTSGILKEGLEDGVQIKGHTTAVRVRFQSRADHCLQHVKVKLYPRQHKSPIMAPRLIVKLTDLHEEVCAVWFCN